MKRHIACAFYRYIRTALLVCAGMHIALQVPVHAADVTWECPGMSSCGYDQVGNPDGIVNEGATGAIETFEIVATPFRYCQPSILTMTDRGTIIGMYRTSGGANVGETGAGCMYCSRRPADSSWSEPIHIHCDSVLAEVPNISHIHGSDTTLAWYVTDYAFDANYSMQKNYLASPIIAVRVSTDDGVTWSEEIMLPEIDRDNHIISDTAYNWFSHTGHRWGYPQRNPFIMMPNGDLVGFAGTAGDYEGNWNRSVYTRSMYLRIPQNNLFHTNPDGDPWIASPVGSRQEWGNSGGSSHNGALYIFDPLAQKLAMLSRTNSLSFSDDGGITWEFTGAYANGDGDIGANQGGAVSLDWWDTTSVLNGWHIRTGGGGGRAHWDVYATDIERDRMSEFGTWDRKLLLADQYDSGSDEINGGIEDG